MAQEKRFRESIEPLLADYCYDCHGDGSDKGDVQLDAFSGYDALVKDKRFWKRVWENLHSQTMPPAQKPHPTDPERERLLSWIEREVFKFDPSVPDPGRVTIRRLNRVEYDNAIRDLTEVDFQPAKDFPPDDTGYGFDTVGDALSLSPLLLEKYLAAADKILDRALGKTSPRVKPRRYSSREMIGDGYSKEERVLSKTGEVKVSFKVPISGLYRFRASAWATRAGTELAKMRFRVNDHQLRIFEVAQEPPGEKVYEAVLELKKGKESFFHVAFLNNFYDPQNPILERRDRNLFLGWLEVEPPPPNPSKEVLASRQVILGDRPAGANDREWAQEALKEFATKAYRKPLPPSEAERLLKLYDFAAKDNGSFWDTIGLPLKAVLVSPNFLFRAESQPRADDPKTVHLIDEFSLASRLSFFLWSTLPDERLLDLAEQNLLRKNLASEVQRMIGDSKIKEFVKNFAGQWLQLRDLDLVNPDQKRFPGFSDKLRNSMRAETETFFHQLLKENRPVTEFLDADYTYLNDVLARHYGLEATYGKELRRVSKLDFVLEDVSPRGGLLTQASILTITSNPTRTSPVKRGKWILDNILGTPAKDPPPDVPELNDNSPQSVGKTLREQLSAHSSKPICASCHVSMDAIGFALENYDAVGRWRDMDSGKPIDSNGKLATGESFTGASELQAFICDKRKEGFVRCMIEKLLIYALGRGLDYYDRPAIAKVISQSRKDGFSFADIILFIIQSDPFQKRRGESPPN